MNDVKYIIVKIGPSEIETAIVFDSILSHSDIAKNWHKDNVISAGFVEFFPQEKIAGKVTCCVYGESTILKLKSRKEDREIIARSIIKFRD